VSINIIMEGARSEGRQVLTEDESKQILALAGIPSTPCRVVESPGEAARAAGEMGFPVALKVRSTIITHKSDVGGVYLNLDCPEQVSRAFNDMREKVRGLDPGAGATVQPMAPPGVEVIIGMTTDSHFGPVMAFGLGGAAVEVLGDLSFRMAPITTADALEMIHSIKGIALLKGYRGRPGADLTGLADMLAKVSQLVTSYPGIREIDLNPVIAHPGGSLAADARIVISEYRSQTLR